MTLSRWESRIAIDRIRVGETRLVPPSMWYPALAADKGIEIAMQERGDRVEIKRTA